MVKKWGAKNGRPRRPRYKFVPALLRAGAREGTPHTLTVKLSRHNPFTSTSDLGAFGILSLSPQEIPPPRHFRRPCDPHLAVRGAREHPQVLLALLDFLFLGASPPPRLTPELPGRCILLPFLLQLRCIPPSLPPSRFLTALQDSVQRVKSRLQLVEKVFVILPRLTSLATSSQERPTTAQACLGRYPAPPGRAGLGLELVTDALPA